MEGHTHRLRDIMVSGDRALPALFIPLAPVLSSLMEKSA